MTRDGNTRPPPSKLPEAVLFDMDDTIFDHSLTCRSALVRLRQHEPAFRRQPLLTLWREYLRLLDLAHPEVLAGRRTIAEVRVERFRALGAMCGLSLTAQEATGLSQEYRRFYQELRRPVPGVQRVLERLRGRTVVGVVTNNEVAEQESKLDFLGFRPLLDFMVISEGVGVAKPDPAIFRIALSKAGALPQDTVMIGDSWQSDVVGARNAGIRPIWFNRFHAARPDPWPVREIDSYRSPADVENAIADSSRDAAAGS